jgi:uncharacterized protein
MKRDKQMIGCVALLVSSVAAAQTLRGRVSDQRCGGNVDAACNKKCIAAGIPPVLVVDGSGQVLAVKNQESLKAFAGEHVEVTGKLESGGLAVESVKSLEEAAPASAAPAWAGDWAGIYRIGTQTTAVRLHFKQESSSTVGTLDLLPRESGIELKGLHADANGFQAESEYAGARLTLSAHLQGESLEGTAQQGGHSGSLRLIRVGTIDPKEFASYEGMYRVGPRVFLIEYLAAQFANVTELPSGNLRNLFPVGASEFITGPSLMEALPERQRLKFVRRDVSAPYELVLTENGEQVVAKPVPFAKEEVSFRNGDVSLKGTLVLPITPGPHPAIIFMHGSGEAPRNGYFGLGYWLASKGFVVLKYDKRGSQESGGMLMNFTYQDLADDAVAGARLLQGRKEVDPRRIGFWGISEGAWTAPLAAARFPEAAFVIAASGGGLSPDVSEMFDSEDQLRNDGRFSEKDIQEALAFQRARDRYMKTGEGWEEYAAARAEAVKKPWYGYPTTDLFGWSKPDSSAWKEKAMYYFYDPTPALRTLRCPFLGVDGALDDPLETGPNTSALKKALGSGRTRDYTIHVLPRANHDLFETPTSSDSELPRTRGFVPGFFPYVTAWLERVTAKKAAGSP